MSAVPQSGDEAVEVAAEDLPLYCPNPRMPLWSAHPRVFLDIATRGEIACPYCGTAYRLRPGTVLKGHH
ncbi:MAG TPA: zinc-finger domain-containing protein [Burkholderiaceae bacterium]|nr:zinc-finger domain-containing protein [Burkholderiaceae bacterium]